MSRSSAIREHAATSSGWRTVALLGCGYVAMTLLVALLPSRSTGMGPASPAVTAGAEVWRAANCIGCPSIYGLGGHICPDLPHSISRLGAGGVVGALYAGDGKIPRVGFADAAGATLVAWESLGDPRYFIAKASAYASEREVFGAPIGRNQGIQFPIARAWAATEAAEMMVRKAAALFEAGLACGPEANTAKLLASEAAWAAAESCLQTHGGYGFAEEYDIERKYRETRLYQIAPISTNMILAYLGHKVLGMPRSY